MNDLDIARLYVAKAQSAASRHIPFTLSFTSFKNLMRAKRCQYTGISLTYSSFGGKQKATDRTIDRIDSTKGYVKGNVKVCCFAANQLKSTWENPNGILKQSDVERMLNNLSKINRGVKSND